MLGTTRVGKTRLAELFVTQDIRRKNAAGEHEVVIVIDPKGTPTFEADVCRGPARGREGEFYIFHLGWLEISAPANAVGRFGRISEVATAWQGSSPAKATAPRSGVRMAVRQHHRPRPWWTGAAPDYMLIQRRHQHRRAVHRVRPALLRQD